MTIIETPSLSWERGDRLGTEDREGTSTESAESFAAEESESGGEEGPIMAGGMVREHSLRPSSELAVNRWENDAPIPDYLRLNVPEILEKIRDLPPDQFDRVISFERAHRNRKTLLIKLGRMKRAFSTAGLGHNGERASGTAVSHS
jgi:hypothetical protein